jgi:hypothetical protein
MPAITLLSGIASPSRARRTLPASQTLQVGRPDLTLCDDMTAFREWLHVMAAARHSTPSVRLNPPTVDRPRQDLVLARVTWPAGVGRARSGLVSTDNNDPKRCSYWQRPWAVRR